jgi:thiosulfate dehydrogenase [quinone] large subunit
MSAKAGEYRYYAEPRFARWLFGSTQAAWIWLVARLYLGYEWTTSGWDKITDPAWMKTGVALKGFSEFAATELTKGDHPAVAYGWYESFLNWIADGNYQWMAKLVAVGELVIGVALILGLFTGIAAFLGAVLNFSFMFAGSAGVNPLFVMVGIGLILAWRIAGYYGLDRWVLPALGTPTEPGPVLDTVNQKAARTRDAQGLAHR